VGFLLVLNVMFMNYYFLFKQSHSLCGFKYYWYVGRRLMYRSLQTCLANINISSWILYKHVKINMVKTFQPLPIPKLHLLQFTRSNNCTIIQQVVEISSLKLILRYFLSHSIYRYVLQTVPPKTILESLIPIFVPISLDLATIISLIHFCYSFPLAFYIS
jgi:hypothetical protein